MAYAERVRKQLRLHQAAWNRLVVAAAVVVVIPLTLALNNCGCDQQSWLTRLALIGAVGFVFAVELIWGRWPRLLFALGVAAPVGWLIFNDNGSVSGLLLLVMVGWTAYTGGLRDSLLASGLGIIAILGYVHFDTPDRWSPWIAGIATTGLMMRLIVAQQTLVQQLRAAQADLEHTAVAAERRRIAGEIHDVAAHALALTVLHLTGLRLRILREGGDPSLVDSVAEAERLGRQSLDDIRRTVGLLQDDTSGIAPPLPGGADIRPLVDEYRAGGLDVGLQLRGEPAAVAPAIGLALYRIVQESLANAVKHAPGAAVRIQLELNGRVSLTIRNAIIPGATSSNGTGHGLAGMRERAQSVGGRLCAGPDDRGWLVECVIPGGELQR
jgi:signal transduction histidine kinase